MTKRTREIISDIIRRAYFQGYDDSMLWDFINQLIEEEKSQKTKEVIEILNKFDKDKMVWSKDSRALIVNLEAWQKLKKQLEDKA